MTLICGLLTSIVPFYSYWLFNKFEINGVLKEAKLENPILLLRYNIA